MLHSKVLNICEALTSTKLDNNSIYLAAKSKTLDKIRKKISKHFAVGIKSAAMAISYTPYSRNGFIVKAKIENGEQITLLVNKEELLQRAEVAIESESVFYCNISPLTHFELGFVYLVQDISMYPDKVKGKTVEMFNQLPVKNHPENNYTKWSTHDDESLKAGIMEDRGIKEMGMKLKRSAIAIVERMVHLDICTVEVGHQLTKAIKERH